MCFGTHAHLAAVIQRDHAAQRELAMHTPSHIFCKSEIKFPQANIIMLSVRQFSSQTVILLLFLRVQIEDEWMANLVINKSILKMILKSVLYFPIFFSSHFISRAYNLHFTEFTVTDFKTHDYFTYH